MFGGYLCSCRQWHHIHAILISVRQKIRRGKGTSRIINRNNKPVCRSRSFRNKRVHSILRSGLFVADTQAYCHPRACASRVPVAKLPKIWAASKNRDNRRGKYYLPVSFIKFSFTQSRPCQSGPDGVGNLRVSVEERRFIGHGGSSPEASGDTQYIMRGVAVRNPFPLPQKARYL